MSDSTSSSSATLTLGGTVITGTIVDYETADYTVFDGTTAYSASGSSILGVLLVEFAIPSDATSGNYVPQVLLNGAAVSLLPATVEIVGMLYVGVTTTNPASGSISALAAGIAFTLTINDALVAPTLVATDAAQTINGVVTADGGNAYTGVLTINVAGSYSLAVEVSGTAVTGYPQTITVEPVALNGAYCHQKEALPSTILAGA